MGFNIILITRHLQDPRERCSSKVSGGESTGSTRQHHGQRPDGGGESFSLLNTRESANHRFFKSFCAGVDSCLKHFLSWQSLEQQLAALQADMEQLRQKAMPEEPSISASHLQELQAQWVNTTCHRVVLQCDPDTLGQWRIHLHPQTRREGPGNPGSADWAGSTDQGGEREDGTGEERVLFFFGSEFYLII